MHKKNVLVTGASRGIGFETSKAVVDKGHHVIATARSSEALTRLKNYAPEEIDVMAGDITEMSTIRMFSSHLDKYGIQLDGIIHNAGLLINKPFTELTDSDWQRMININIMAPVRLTRNLLKNCRKQSHILTISSMGGFQNSAKFTGLSGYSTSKGALGIFTECLSVELAGMDIRSNCLCLGAVQTEMFEKAFPEAQAPVQSSEMGTYIADFILNGHLFYNGRILPVALADPQ